VGIQGFKSTWVVGVGGGGSGSRNGEGEGVGCGEGLGGGRGWWCRVECLFFTVQLQIAAIFKPVDPNG
jgi:hypothetical protein